MAQHAFGSGSLIAPLGWRRVKKNEKLRRSSIRRAASCALVLVTSSPAVSAESSNTSGQVVTTVTGPTGGTVSTTVQTTSESALAAAQARATLQQSQIANVNSAFTGSGIAGTITPGTGAGTEEGNLLTAVAINAAAVQILKSIDYQANYDAKSQGILVIGGNSGFDLSTALIYKDNSEKISSDLADALAAYSAAIAPPGRAGEPRFAPLLLAGLALGVADKAFSYLMTNYQISGASVAVNDYMLAVAIVSRAPQAVIFTQSLALGVGERIIEQLKQIDGQAAKANDAVSKGTLLLARWKKAKKSGEAISNLSAALDKLKSATSEYTSFELWLLGGISGTTALNSNLATVVQQTAAYSVMQGGGAVLYVQIHSAAGGFIAKQNLWSQLGAMPFYASGGVVVSFTLYGQPNQTTGVRDKVLTALTGTGQTGTYKLLKAKLFGVVLPYRKVIDVPHIVELDKFNDCDTFSQLFAPGGAMPPKDNAVLKTAAAAYCAR